MGAKKGKKGKGAAAGKGKGGKAAPSNSGSGAGGKQQQKGAPDVNSILSISVLAQQVVLELYPDMEDAGEQPAHSTACHSSIGADGSQQDRLALLPVKSRIKLQDMPCHACHRLMRAPASSQTF